MSQVGLRWFLRKKKTNWTVFLKLSIIVLYQCLLKKKKTTIKICCHACLKDMMGQTPPLYACTGINHACHFISTLWHSWKQGFFKIYSKKTWQIESLVLRTIWYIICEKSHSFKQHQLKMFLKCLPSRSWFVSFWIRCFVHAFSFIFFPFHEFFWNFFKLKGDDLYTKSMQ